MRNYGRFPPRTLLKSTLFEKNHYSNSLEGNVPIIFSDGKKNRKAIVAPILGEITPMNRHCLRCLDGKYGKRNEILKNIRNGISENAQNETTENYSEEDDDDDDEDNAMSEDIGKNYDTSEKDGRCIPICADPQEDVIQIHTDEETLQVENSTITTLRSRRTLHKSCRYGGVPYIKNFCL